MARVVRLTLVLAPAIDDWTPGRPWFYHGRGPALQISVHGTNLQASLNGKHLLDYTLAEAVSGRVGVWAKTDGVSYFDDYTVGR